MERADLFLVIVGFWGC